MHRACTFLALVMFLAVTIPSHPPAVVGGERKLKIQGTEKQEEMVLGRKTSRFLLQHCTMKICTHTGTLNYTVNIL